MSDVYMHVYTYESVRNAHTYIAKLVLQNTVSLLPLLIKTVYIYCRLLRVAGQDGKMAHQINVLQSKSAS